MPKSRKVVNKSKSRSSRILLLVVIAVVAFGAIGAGYFLFSKNGIVTKKVASLPKITKPIPDMSRARVLTIDPTVENIMQVTTKEKVIITLTIPKGAVDKKLNIKMIPYYHNNKSDDPSDGVIISPGNISFKVPVTLMFDLSDSKLRTDAPDNVGKMEQLRTTGTSQVLMIDQDATELIPTLIAREVETSTQLRSRILTGGGYLFSVDGKDQKRWAERAMQKEKVNSISILEASRVLLTSGIKLNKKEHSKANAAADKILGKNLPPPHEMVAAITVKKLLTNKKSGFKLVSQAFAREGAMSAAPSTPRQVIEFVCKSKGLTVEAYVGYAAAAWNYGYGDLRDKCMTVALNKAADDARKLLADKDASIKSMLVALKNLQFLGIDEMTDLGDKLTEKIKWKAEDEAKRVAYDIDATPVEMAMELQKLQKLGVEGATADLLTERMVDVLDEQEANMPTPPPEDFEEETDYSEEQVIADQAWAIIGIELLKAMGFTDFSEAGLKAKFKEMTDAAHMLNEAVYPLCVELGGENCDKIYNESKQKLDENLQDGYRVAEEIGSVQNSAYEEPDYDESHGSYYFEEELTPTPEEDEGNEETVEDDSADDYEDSSEQEEELESQREEEVEEEGESGDLEVQGAQTSNPFKVMFQNVKTMLNF